MNAISGDATAGMISFSTMPCPLTAPDPTAARTAPTKPPIRACEELDGRPKYHVIRFHAIAPIRPANTTVVVTAPVATNPFAIVVAPFREINAPTKFRTDAIAIARRGPTACVEIDVATTFAVS